MELVCDDDLSGGGGLKVSLLGTHSRLADIIPRKIKKKTERWAVSSKTSEYHRLFNLCTL